MINYSINKLADIIGGSLQTAVNGDAKPISNISIDSRTIVDPDSCLFFALKGERHDGHRYIEGLYKKGVRNFVVSQLPTQPNQSEHANLIVVKNTLTALQQLAAHVRNEFDFPVLAITGSNGKTIVKEWLFDLLQSQFRIVRSPKSYNSQVGVPLSLWNMNRDADLGIIEAGISKPAEMIKLADLIHPEFGIITTIGDAHQENFKTLEEKLTEKLKLFEGAELLVYRKDSALIDQVINNKFKNEHTKLFSWSTGELKADLLIRIEKSLQKSTLYFSWLEKSYETEIPFTDDASLENVCHCLAFIAAKGWLKERLLSQLSSLQPVAMRLELKQGINDCLLVNDYYNSDINSLEIALQFLNQQTSSSRQQKTVILSDIRQSGFPARQLYAEVSRLLKLNKVNRLIGIGQNIAEHGTVFEMTTEFYPSTLDFVQNWKSHNFKDEAILIKGAREFRFEEIALLLQKKYHQTQLEVNLNSLVENLNIFKEKVKPQTKIMAMVKAFSYGSGTVEIARALEFQKIDYLAVAVADEGIELRQAGIETPIVVMNPEGHSFEAMIEYRLEPNVYSAELFRQFNAVAKSSAVSYYPIHIKIETGMNRLGFSEVNELKHISQQINHEEVLRIQSVFTHLAGSDEAQHDEYTRKQYQQFIEISDIVVSFQKNKVIRHILNSAGIERFPEFQLDMVRLGIGLYGVAATSNTPVRPIARWTSVISQIKTVNVGDTIGYGRKGKADKAMTIAIVPVGYADGFLRHFSNGVGKMWINGTKAPVIGNVCMDMTMIDVSEANAQVGDSVELMGEHIHLTDLAEWAETIPYEILTGISQRVKRVYSQE
ncbi:bifunctional UDP-N-acetylmuramoyl-tripeptide:D-alanyl-D-alanine ligase/alanine racemase [Sunxiuqinia indica]|uniref:bifunctional UDP-N-acetylmuramoyl-tripeptide:D-alanyl-D-alanine ligase/alanine racemase n=1 Tax=Sunxiuqinia indica TaxID=2692584 RepID=UPI001356E522|nr:bifunctional UDP-N-acetylmuramoyl-tripeptide:D-alanyl-D-alanine ligase/alanine racemase [Sunxiuqinia indica]